MFFLVSGASAAGKSTVVRKLPNRLQNIECHDSDEKLSADEYTRCQRLEEWIGLALAVEEKGQDFLLTSQSPLGELLACPSATKLTGIAACLLDCADTVRITRMRARGISPRWPPSQHTLNWAAWHRMHAWDPQWEPHVIEGNGPSTHSYQCWRRWLQTDPRWRVTVIDTTDLSVDQVLDRMAAWVSEERARVPLLSADSHWWE